MVPTQVGKFLKLQGVVLGRQVVPGMEIPAAGGGGGEFESKSAICGADMDIFWKYAFYTPGGFANFVCGERGVILCLCYKFFLYLT